MSSGLATMLGALLSFASTGPFNSKVFPYAPFLARKRLPLPGSQDALLRYLSWQPMRPVLALRWAFSRRISPACHHRSVLPFLLPSVTLHADSPTRSRPCAGCHRPGRQRRGREDDSDLRRYGGERDTHHTSRSLIKNAQVSRFCPIRLQQRFQVIHW